MIYLKCGRFEWIQSDPCNGVAPLTYILEWKIKKQSYLELPDPSPSHLCLKPQLTDVC